MAEIQYFIDNQNCLWIPNKPEEISEEEINPLSQILEKAENKNKSLYLNHSTLIDKYENPDVIIPNNIETFFYRITFRNCIKRIYVPASVKKITISPSSDYSFEEHSVEFIVSEKNENFVSVKGSIYTKDFKTLIYSAQKKGIPFLIDSRCEEIADGCKLFIDKKLYFDKTSSNITPNLKTINFRGLISNTDKLEIPEGVETLKKGTAGIKITVTDDRLIGTSYEETGLVNTDFEIDVVKAEKNVNTTKVMLWIAFGLLMVGLVYLAVKAIIDARKIDIK